MARSYIRWFEDIKRDCSHGFKACSGFRYRLFARGAPGLLELNGSAEPFRPKAQRRWHIRRQASRS
jgi:hypothetical protein